MGACRFMQLVRRYELGKIFFPDSQGNIGFLGIGLHKKLTSVTNDGSENMYVSTTGVKTSGKEILTALDSTYLRKQAFPVMNFRESKFCSELNDHRLHHTLRATSVSISHSPGVQRHPTSVIPVKSVMTFKTSLFGKLRRTFCLYQPIITGYAVAQLIETLTLPAALWPWR
jgi:hypothetical protein